MDDIFLTAAGLGGMLVALLHGWLGRARVLRRIDGLGPELGRVNCAVFQLSTLYWFAAGVALVAAPHALDPAGRAVLASGAAFLYGSGALANLWATRGRHFGWVLLLALSLMALLGA